MFFRPRVQPNAVLGRPLDRLSIREMKELAGLTVAVEVYTPETLPLRMIEAIGDSAEACMTQLVERGKNPRSFEFVRLKPPY